MCCVPPPHPVQPYPGHRSRTTPRTPALPHACHTARDASGHGCRGPRPVLRGEVRRSHPEVHRPAQAGRPPDLLRRWKWTSLPTRSRIEAVQVWGILGNIGRNPPRAESVHTLAWGSCWGGGAEALGGLPRMKAGTDVNVHRCNRARSYLRLQVYNKALKDADEVLRQDPALWPPAPPPLPSRTACTAQFFFPRHAVFLRCFPTISRICHFSTFKS